MKAVVAAFNQEKALVGAFSVITNLRIDFFEALMRNGDLVLGRHLQSPDDAPAVAPVVGGPGPGPLLLLPAAQDGLQARAEADTLQLLLGQAEVVVQR